ncbi:hypothetical protein [Pseudoflavonifractor sp. MSJ-37]|uniref:hypothetical protein n=1 Tax=Pseudoflavonifractor sp. MSJ-37 TaxID=2841531 RepID=UPI001C0FE166|nr:hypothetical protein [Pseudoflavonifractor sp. MSJ-37]MBU5434528.1 hypothetical protein [Pseudoflavonifractor sp. MSJ-37]
MESRSRNILVVLIALVIAVGVFSSFGMDSFTPESPPITLPPVEDASAGDGDGADGDGSLELLRVEVTPETVQDVIATLARPASYSRQVTVSLPETGGSITSRIWSDGGWTRSDTTLPGGTVRHSIVGDGTVRYWYGNSRSYAAAPADRWSADLEGPHIPTYEDLLEVERSRITKAGYEDKDGAACIYAEVSDPSTGDLSRWWVAVDSGLLTAAELVEDGVVVLRMTASAAERPVAAGADFSLPDRTVLHTVQPVESGQ